MTTYSKEAIRKTAMRVYRDKTAATLDDAAKMAAAILLLLDGKLPK
jgi:hypothetical protein